MRHARADDGARAGDVWVGKRVLVTGAAGSVGAALSLRLASSGCARLGLLDQFDHGLLAVTEAVERGKSQGVQITDLLCDVRDGERLCAQFARFAPDIVIHAAALKHVHLGERHPGECVLTNLMGTRNALEASAQSGATDFVLISTDKAAAPVCTMGAVKRLAELYLRGFALERQTCMRLRAVRFGNVLGSQGSVEPRFAAQIAAGGPVEITHPDMQRFFMTADEAVTLILSVLSDASAPQASVFVKNMGAPVSVLELAHQMMDEFGRRVPIAFVGPRPGEKLTELLFDEFEQAQPSCVDGAFAVTPNSAQASASSADLAGLERLARSMNEAGLRQRVFALLGERLGVSQAGAPRCDSGAAAHAELERAAARGDA